VSNNDGTDEEAMDQSSAIGVQGFLSVVRRFLESAGGFTLHQRTGEHVRDGVSVCADPTATLMFPLAEWDDERVETWFQTWAGRLRGNDLHLGGWLDPVTRLVSLDVVRVYPASCRGEAVHLGHTHRQKAVFDLGEGRLLALAATGAIVGVDVP